MPNVDFSKIIQDREQELRAINTKAGEMLAVAEVEKRALTDAEDKEIRSLQEQQSQLKSRIGMLRKQAELDHELGETPDPTTRGKIRGGNPVEDDDEDEQEKRESGRRQKRYARAFNEYLRFGGNTDPKQMEVLREGLRPFEKDERAVIRNLSSQIGVDGGFTVPQGFMNTLEVALKQFGGVLQSGVTEHKTTSGNDIPYPTTNDTNNKGRRVDESQPVGRKNPTFGQVTLKGSMYSSEEILVPIQLLQDSAFDIESMIANIAGERIGRALNEDLTKGNGANQPQGVAFAVPQGQQAASSTAIAYPDLIDLEHSVDAAYRTKAKYMMHDTTVKALKKLLDSNGRPIWQRQSDSGMHAGAPGTLNDYPYIVNNDMDQIGAGGKKSVLFGDFSKYHVRRVRDIVLIRLDELYATSLMKGFLAFVRYDGRLVDAGTNPIKALVHA